MSEEELEYHRNWMMLAFRALNDAHGVISQITPECGSEEELLAELLKRIKNAVVHVPAFIGTKLIEARMSEHKTAEQRP